MELTINGKEYRFRFGIGFVRKLDGKNSFEKSGIRFGMGLESEMPKLIMRDVVALSDLLYAANETETPRIKQSELDGYIDNKDTDIENLFDSVVTELKKSNATKLKVANLLEEMEKEEKKIKKA
jgi:hypothetical protein